MNGEIESQAPHNPRARVSEHFTLLELACRHCGQMRISEDFIDQLEALRVEFDRTMSISSGYRCPEHNARVSSTGMDGPHTIGAVDVLLSGEDAYDLLIMAPHFGFHGLGIHQRGPYTGRFIHLDRRSARRVWSY